MFFHEIHDSPFSKDNVRLSVRKSITGKRERLRNVSTFQRFGGFWLYPKEEHTESFYPNDSGGSFFQCFHLVFRVWQHRAQCAILHILNSWDFRLMSRISVPLRTLIFVYIKQVFVDLFLTDN